MPTMAKTTAINKKMKKMSPAVACLESGEEGDPVDVSLCVGGSRESGTIENV